MGNTSSQLKQCILSMKAKLESMFPTSSDQPLSSTAEIAVDLEAAAASIAEDDHEPQAVPPIDDHPQRIQHLQWPAIVAAFCLSAAVQNLQFHLFRLALVFAVSAMFMATQLSLKFPNQSRFLERAGVLFGITAFFLIAGDSFPLGFKIATWTVYAILLSVCFLLQNL